MAGGVLFAGFQRGEPRPSQGPLITPDNSVGDQWGPRDMRVQRPDRGPFASTPPLRRSGAASDGVETMDDAAHKITGSVQRRSCPAAYRGGGVRRRTEEGVSGGVR